MTLFELVEQARDVYEIVGDESDVVIEVGDKRYKLEDMRPDHYEQFSILVAGEEIT